MKKIKIPLIIILLILAVLYSAGMLYEAHAETADRERFSPAGRMVNVNGRSMHIYCIGERAPGQPVIILEAGLGAGPAPGGSGRAGWRECTGGGSGLGDLLVFTRP